MKENVWYGFLCTVRSEQQCTTAGSVLKKEKGGNAGATLNLTLSGGEVVHARLPQGKMVCVVTPFYPACSDTDSSLQMNSQSRTCQVKESSSQPLLINQPA